MIMDSKNTIFCRAFFLRFTLHFRINAGANPLEKEVGRQIAPGAFAAAIAEFNNRNGNFDDVIDV